jgi:hypothetical protein
MTNEAPVVQAIEQLPIPLFDGVVLAARTKDGLIHLSLRDLCSTIGLDTTSQRRRIRANESLHLTSIRVHIERQFRTLDFLPLDDLALWILTLQTARIHPESQNRVSYIKQYLETSVRHAFAQLTGLPETSRQVEDLRELDRLDHALELLEQLNERQSTIEISQDRARIAFRDLAEMVRSVQSRVQALEAQAKLRLSTTQRGTIYQLVQTWGSAQAERQKDQRSGEAIRACWRLFNQRFGISTYTDLPAAKYDDAIQFIKEQYRSLTGKAIDAVEQSGLDLESL